MNKNVTINRILQQIQISLKQSDSGQIIILMAFIMIVLLAVAGLAIDGGRLVYLKRNIQNAVDAALLASAHALCIGATDVEVTAAGELAAMENGYSDMNAKVEVITPPPSEHPKAGENNYVYVMIDAEVPLFFIQLIWGDDAGTAVSGTAYCNTQITAAAAPPLVDESTAFFVGGHCGKDDSIDWAGDNNHIYGDIHSNGGWKSHGNNNVVSGAALYVTEDDGTDGIVAANGVTGGGTAKFWPFSYVDMIPSETSVSADSINIFNSNHPDFAFQHLINSGEITYTNCDGACNLSGTINGIYFGSEINIASNTQGEATLVSTGEISFSGEGNASDYAGTFEQIATDTDFKDMDYANYGIRAYYKNLLAVSSYNEDCGGASIQVNGNYWVLQGIMYGPDGGFHHSGDDNVLYICEFSESLKHNGDNNIFQCVIDDESLETRSVSITQ